MAKTSDEVATLMPTPYPVGSGTNNRKLIDSFHTGWIGPLFDDLDDLFEVSHVVDMYGSTLESWANGTLGLPRRVGEGDPDYLIRIKGEVRRRIGGSTNDDIIEFINLVIGGEAGPGDITIVENSDGAGGYSPATYTVTVNQALLIAVGIPTANIPATLQNIEDILNETAAAGVRGVVAFQSGADWGTAEWDATDDVWGS